MKKLWLCLIELRKTFNCILYTKIGIMSKIRSLQETLPLALGPKHLQIYLSPLQVILPGHLDIMTSILNPPH